MMKKFTISITALLLTAGVVFAEVDPRAMKAIKDIQDGRNNSKAAIHALRVMQYRGSSGGGNIQSNLNVGANLSVTNDIIARRNLIVDGVITNVGPATFGDVNVTNDLDVRGWITVGDSVSISNVLNVDDSVSIGSNLTVGADSIIASNMVVGGTFSVSGVVDFASTLQVNTRQVIVGPDGATNYFMQFGDFTNGGQYVVFPVAFGSAPRVLTEWLSDVSGFATGSNTTLQASSVTVTSFVPRTSVPFDGLVDAQYQAVGATP